MRSATAARCRATWSRSSVSASSGHLGVQFANKLGLRTVAIARGADKEALARKLGAHYFIDNASEDVAAALNRLGGARAVLATVTSAKAMTPAIDGLAVRGRLIVVGVDPEPIQVTPLQLIGGSRSVVGHAAGASIDSEDTLVFSALTGVRPMIETQDGAGDGVAPMLVVGA
jgi:D-arabinose 1-dehydrogenase-like Zn-dependent alcohol dehydrogenase